ncbi:MAG: hypothetical protein R3E87_18470 [Burkholderiaceae bacterium]
MIALLLLALLHTGGIYTIPLYEPLTKVGLLAAVLSYVPLWVTFVRRGAFPAPSLRRARYPRLFMVRLVVELAIITAVIVVLLASLIAGR